MCPLWQLFVRVTDENTGNEYLWNKTKFLVRYSYMQEMYQKYEELGRVPEVSQVLKCILVSVALYWTAKGKMFLYMTGKRLSLQTCITIIIYRSSSEPRLKDH